MESYINKRIYRFFISTVVFLAVSLAAFTFFSQRALAAVTTLYPTEDALVNSASPAQKYGSLGYLSVSYQGGYTTLSFVKFNFDSIPANATITAARLIFFKLKCSGDLNQLLLGKVNTNWSEAQINWNTRPGFSQVASRVGDCTVQQGFNVLTAVNNWRAGQNNYGFALYAAAGPGVFERQYDSREGANKPLLSIEYTVPSPTPQQPAATNPTVTPTASPAANNPNTNPGNPDNPGTNQPPADNPSTNPNTNPGTNNPDDLGIPPFIPIDNSFYDFPLFTPFLDTFGYSFFSICFCCCCPLLLLLLLIIFIVSLTKRKPELEKKTEENEVPITRANLAEEMEKIKKEPGKTNPPEHKIGSDID